MSHPTPIFCVTRLMLPSVPLLYLLSLTPATSEYTCFLVFNNAQCSLTHRNFLVNLLEMMPSCVHWMG